MKMEFSFILVKQIFPLANAAAADQLFVLAVRRLFSSSCLFMTNLNFYNQ